MFTKSKKKVYCCKMSVDKGELCVYTNNSDICLKIKSLTFFGPQRCGSDESQRML